MWRCSNCGEETEDDGFETCWNCQYDKDGRPPPVKEVPQQPSQTKDPERDFVVLYEAAKWCPQCEGLNALADKTCRKRKCGHVFRGDELGAKPIPKIIDTESQSLGDDMIANRLLALSDDPAENVVSRKEDLRICLIHIGKALLLALGGIVMMAIAVFYIGSKGGSVSGAIGLFGLGAFLVGVGYFVASVWWYFRVPKFTLPKQVTDCFYGELMGPAEGSVSRAWSCLDPEARAEFKSLEAFREHWLEGQKNMKQWALDATKHLLPARPAGRIGDLKCETQLRSAKINNITENTADFCCEILVVPYEEVDAGKNLAGIPRSVAVHYQVFAWPQSKTLLKGPDRWYLTSGTLDGPDGWCASPSTAD